MSKKKPQREAHYSPVRFILESKTSHQSPPGKFVPFSQERDGLGRLIKPKNCQQNTISPRIRKSTDESDGPKLVHTLTPQICISLTDRVNLLEGQISKAFEYRGPQEVKLFDGNKIRIRKSSCHFDIKDSYGILSRRLSTQHNIIPQKSDEMVQEVRRKQSDTESFMIRKKGSLKSLPSIRQNPQKRQRKLTMAQSNESRHRREKTEEIVIKKSVYGKPVPKLTRIPQKTNPLHTPIQTLESYRRWPRLNDNIEQNNDKFLAKVWQSKKLSYQVKQSLRELDECM